MANENVITGDQYAVIAELYAQARSKMLLTSGYLYDAVEAVVALDVVVPEIDLLEAFYETYKIQTAALQSDVTLLPAVRALNQHVTNNYTATAPNSYDTTLDAYLGENTAADFTGADILPLEWADLSESAGYTIGSAYVGPAV